ncbi:MAG: nicotinate-nicotinamide nucleotide adenylyltransferase [Candidatus Diapherotrites archaeon]|nr:nicotinate-nicotinamide nucleotide adenylyltransferase [Candidatus Diapherotrites archaeon]
MKIALFGGTFDPVHNGHLAAAKAALKKTRADELWFVPAFRNPWKKRQPSLPKHRLAMLRLAAKANAKFKVKDFEIRNRTSHTLDLVDFLLKKFPEHEFIFVVSTKTKRQLHRWKNAKALLKKISVCVVPDFGGNLNSTRIRALAKKGLPLEGLVPEAVEKFILAKKLYRD